MPIDEAPWYKDPLTVVGTTLCSLLLAIAIGWPLVDLIGRERLGKLTASDWAAWMQALGSILGLGIAIYLPYRERAQLRRDAELSAIRIIGMSRSAVDRLRTAVHGSATGRYPALIDELIAMSDALATVNVGVLRPHLLGAYLILRAVNTQAARFAQSLPTDLAPSPADRDAADRLAVRARDAILAVKLQGAAAQAWS